MNWLVFALVTYAALVLQQGLGALLAVPMPGVGELTPSLLLIVLVFVALHAPAWSAVWAGLVLGLLADLQPGPMPEARLIGPHALGFLAGAYALLQLRGMVFRQSIITFAALTLTAGVFVTLVSVALLTVRGLPWPLGEPIPGWHAADQLVHRFLELIYTTLLSIPLGTLLARGMRLWAFPERTDRWPSARG